MYLAPILIVYIFVWFQFGPLALVVLSLLSCLVILRYSVSSALCLLALSLVLFANLSSQLAHKLPIRFQHQDVTLNVCFEQLPQQYSDEYFTVVGRVQQQPAELSLRKIRLSSYQAHAAFVNAQAGDCLSGVFRLKQPLGRIIPGAFNADRYYFAQNIDAIGHVQTITKHDQAPSVAERLYNRNVPYFTDETARAVWAALTLGWSASMPAELKGLLAANQMMHLFVISGMHFSFLALCIAGVIRLLSLVLSRYVSFGLTAQFVATTMLLFLYLLLIGLPLPAVRSFIMLLIPMACYFWGVKVSLFKSLSWAALVICVWQPQSWLSASVWLSFCSVAMLLVVIRWRVFAPQPVWMALFSLQGLMFLVSIVWSWLFGFKLNIASLFMVVVATPLVMFMLLPLSLLIALQPNSIIIQCFSSLVRVFLQGLDNVQSFAITLHWQPFVGVVLLVGFSLSLLWLRHYWGALLIMFSGLMFGIVTLIIASTSAAETRKITVLDVGHGQAVLLQTPQGRYLLDTGGHYGDDSTLYQAVLMRLLPNIDGLIISHADRDHSAAANFIREQKPNLPIWAGQPSSFLHAHTIRNCHHQLAIDDYLTFIPIPEELQTTSNNHSCILQFTVDSFLGLFTSDADKQIEYYLMQHYGHRLPADLIILGHHGSDSSSAEDWLNLHANSLLLSSSSDRVSPIWPSPRIQQWLTDQGKALLNTAQRGTVQIEIEQGGYFIKTWDTAYRKSLIR